VITPSAGLNSELSHALNPRKLPQYLWSDALLDPMSCGVAGPSPRSIAQLVRNLRAVRCWRGFDGRAEVLLTAWRCFVAWRKARRDIYPPAAPGMSGWRGACAGSALEAVLADADTPARTWVDRRDQGL